MDVRHVLTCAKLGVLFTKLKQKVRLLDCLKNGWKSEGWKMMRREGREGGEEEGGGEWKKGLHCLSSKWLGCECFHHDALGYGSS